MYAYMYLWNLLTVVWDEFKWFFSNKIYLLPISKIPACIYCPLENNYLGLYTCINNNQVWDIILSVSQHMFLKNVKTTQIKLVPVNGSLFSIGQHGELTCKCMTPRKVTNY